MAKILITGALGHIGSALIRVIPEIAQNYETILVDNLLTSRYCSLFSLPDNSKCNFHKLDIFDDQFQTVASQADIIIHLAAITDMTTSLDNIEQVEKVNYEGLVKVSNICKANKIPLIFISTTSVFAGLNGTVSEDESIRDGLLTPYARSKYQAEEHLKKEFRDSSLMSFIFRFGTIVGPSPGMRFHTAVNKFIWQSILSEKITVWETALDQERPYLGIQDAIDGILYVCKKILDKSEEIKFGEVYNLATENCTVRTILDKIKIHRPNIEVALVKSAVMNDSSFGVSNSKIERLGFTTSSTLQSEIDKTFLLFGRLNCE